MILIAIFLFAFVLLLAPVKSADRIAVGLTGAGFLFSAYTLWDPTLAISNYGLEFDTAGRLFSTAITFVSLAVLAYSLRHFDGHRSKRLYFRRFVALTISLIVFSTADQLLLMLGGLLLSNFLLTRLMEPNPFWVAARSSARSAFLHLGFGGLMLAGAVTMVYFTQGHLSLQSLYTDWADTPWLPLISGFVILAALAQSAIWPLHNWLIASANAPTPVSAFMHAGLVNGGALILYKFYPLLALTGWSSTVLIALGGLTAVLGTVWMLVQSDVKRTLTCSTMGQMGFMIMQCGLGLFPAALAHMIWHGLFKASLFLSAGSTVKAASNKSLKLEGPYMLPIFVFGLAMGVAGAYIFWLFTNGSGGLGTTYALLLLFCGITCAHAVMTIVQPSPSLGRGLLAAVLGLLGATVYGASVWAVETQIAHLPAPTLNAAHIGIAIFFALGWLAMIFRAHFPSDLSQQWMAPLYVRLLKGSQPKRSTLSMRRSGYKL
jgi:NAD(P)H-quinone oxidoreductase subunit 5